MRRVLIVASILLAVMVAAVILVARSTWVETRLRGAILAAIEDALDADVRVDEAHIRFLPPSVELVGIRAASRARPDLPPILEAARLRVSLDPVLLLAGRVDLDQVRLVQPTVTLVFDKADIVNLPVPKPRPDDRPGGAGVDVVVRTVAVDGGRVRLEFPREGPLTIELNPYGGFEVVGPIGRSLPASDGRLTSEPGDIFLYQGNQVTIFTGANTWSYTRLGKIEGVGAAELRNVFGSDTVSVTFSMA